MKKLLILALLLSGCGMFRTQAQGVVFGKVYRPETWWFESVVVGNISDLEVILVPLHRVASYEIDVTDVGDFVKVFWVPEKQYNSLHEGDKFACGFNGRPICPPTEKPVREISTDEEVRKHTKVKVQ